MELVLMQDTDIFVKTDAGRDEIKSRAHGLSMPVRAILLLVDGQRNVAALKAVIAGSKAGPDTLDALLEKGLIEPRNGAGPVTASKPAPVVATPVAATSAAPVVSPPVFVAPVKPAPVVAPVVAKSDEDWAAAVRTSVSTDVLDLVLPTIHAPHEDEDIPIDAPVVAAVPPENRYEHLYAMMNEVVRDFLPAHRRYFFQLKIERAGDAESLLELLHDLRMALAKSRGDAFASEVVTRLRNAAG